MTTGDVVLVGMHSWAGLTWHQVRVEKVCPKRVRVFWLDSSRRHGTSSYVPKAAIREMAEEARPSTPAVLGSTHPRASRASSPCQKRGHCIECGAAYEAAQIEDGLCPACQRLEPTNDPTPFDDADVPRWKWSKTAMRERLGVTGDRDE